MEHNSDSFYYSFKIDFNKMTIVITYDTSNYQFKTLNIESLIKEVLTKICPNSKEKSVKDYILLCPCGKQLESNILLINLKCNHDLLDNFSKEKIKNNKYLLIEQERNDYKIVNLSKRELDSLVNRELIKGKTKKKNNGSNNYKKLDRKEQSPNFQISKSLENKIETLKTKKERGKIIMDNGYSIYYDESHLNSLIEIGIDKEKAKASLRFTKNNKEEAALIATEEEFYWDNKQYLFYDNNNVLRSEEFKNSLIEEIKKEYPNLENKEEIEQRYEDIKKMMKYDF